MLIIMLQMVNHFNIRKKIGKTEARPAQTAKADLDQDGIQPPRPDQHNH